MDTEFVVEICMKYLYGCGLTHATGSKHQMKNIIFA